MSLSPTSLRPRPRASLSVYPSPGPPMARRSSVASRTTSSGCGPSCHKPPPPLFLAPHFAHPEKCTAHCWLAGRRQLAGRWLYVRFGDVSLSRFTACSLSKSKLCFAHSHWRGRYKCARCTDAVVPQRSDVLNIGVQPKVPCNGFNETAPPINKITLMSLWPMINA